MIYKTIADSIFTKILLDIHDHIVVKGRPNISKTHVRAKVSSSTDNSHVAVGAMLLRLVTADMLYKMLSYAKCQS